MEVLTIVLGIGLIAALVILKTNSNSVLDLKVKNAKLLEENKGFQSALLEIQDSLGKERETNRSLLSQKKSSETRLGQISEHLVPFLAGCTHDPKSLHFLGNPIDYIAFNFDDGAITFLEVKSGNSKASKRQKTIKNIIKSGRVFYEEIRINEKGVKSRVSANASQIGQYIADSEQDEDGKD